MAKRTYTIAFKREVIAFMVRTGETAYAARKYFSDRDGFEYDVSLFYQWYKKKDVLMSACATKKRASGGGRKPRLANMEDLLADEIINLRLQNVKVSRSFIANRARQIAADVDIDLKATGNWVSLFLKRHGFKWRRCDTEAHVEDMEGIKEEEDATRIEE